LCQSFTDWEAVVIDNASTDETATVLDCYRDPRIRVQHHRVNRGHIASFNEGLALAKGELFVLLSADDRYRPAFLERVVDCFDAHPDLAFVATYGERIDESGRVLGATSPLFEDSGVYDGLPRLFEHSIATCAGVARTASLRALGGYDAKLPHTSDTYLWRRLAISASIGYVHERLYERRIHERSLSREAARSRILVSEHIEQLARIFSAADLPARARALRRRAYSEVHWRIATAYSVERRSCFAIAHVLSAARYEPSVLRRHHAGRWLLREVRRAAGRLRLRARPGAR
jgi:glycosyltransferase involved in cell wall biosynthesis